VEEHHVVDRSRIPEEEDIVAAVAVLVRSCLQDVKEGRKVVPLPNLRCALTRRTKGLGYRS